MFNHNTLHQLLRLQEATGHPAFAESVRVMHEDSIMMLSSGDEAITGTDMDAEFLDAFTVYTAHAFVEAPGDIHWSTFINNCGGVVRIIHAGRKLDADVLADWVQARGYIQTSTK